MKREQILEAFATGALKHLQESLAKVLLPSIRVTTRDLDEDESLPPGASRFGGRPDLPEGSEWPTVDSIPLAFVGQVDLADLAALEAAAILPRTGLLSFFFDAMLTGYDQGESPDRCRVIYTPTDATPNGSSTLVSLEPPESVPELFDEYTEAQPKFEEQSSMPELAEIDGDEFPTIPVIVPILATAQDRQRYAKLRKKLRGRYIGSKMLGHPDAVQGGETRFAAVLKEDKGNRFRYEDYSYTNSDELVREMKDLVLLLQAASGDGETWGGTGVVYFWIRRQDLESLRFDRCFARLETT